MMYIPKEDIMNETSADIINLCRKLLQANQEAQIMVDSFLEEIGRVDHKS